MRLKRNGLPWPQSSSCKGWPPSKVFCSVESWPIPSAAHILKPIEYLTGGSGRPRWQNFLCMIQNHVQGESSELQGLEIIDEGGAHATTMEDRDCRPWTMKKRWPTKRGGEISKSQNVCLQHVNINKCQWTSKAMDVIENQWGAKHTMERRQSLNFIAT